MNIICLITEAPYYNPLLGSRLQILENFAQKAEKLVCFFYIEGIHQLNSEQIPKIHISRLMALASIFVNLPQN